MVEVVKPPAPTGTITVTTNTGSSANSSSTTNPPTVYATPNTTNKVTWSLSNCSSPSVPLVYYTNKTDVVSNQSSGSNVEHEYEGGSGTYVLSCDDLDVAAVEMRQSVTPFEVVLTGADAAANTATVRGIKGLADKLIGVEIIPEDDFAGTVTLDVEVDIDDETAVEVIRSGSGTVVCEIDETDPENPVSRCGATSPNPDQEYRFELVNRVPRDSYNVVITASWFDGVNTQSTSTTAQLRVLNLVSGNVVEF